MLAHLYSRAARDSWDFPLSLQGCSTTAAGMECCFDGLKFYVSKLVNNEYLGKQGRLEIQTRFHSATTQAVNQTGAV